MPIAKVENGVAVLYENEWRFCTPESSAYEDASTKTGNTSVLKEPPQLTILYADEGITALRGTYSWTYQDEDKTFMGIESDSLHPLQSKEYMPSLHLTRSTLSHIEPFSAYLQFETVPNQLTGLLLERGAMGSYRCRERSCSSFQIRWGSRSTRVSNSFKGRQLYL